MKKLIMSIPLIIVGLLLSLNSCQKKITGNVSFFAESDFNCGDITVYVKGYGDRDITSYYSNGITSCNKYGCANFNLPIGNYDFTASCNSLTWSGNFNITENDCLRFELTY